MLQRPLAVFSFQRIRLLPLGVALGACGDHDHGHAHADAAHAAGAAADGGAAHTADDAEAQGDHGHGDHEHTGDGEDPRPTLSLTVTTAAFEAFVELPALVVGQPSRLLAHLTRSHDPQGFAPVVSGSLHVVLRTDDGAEQMVVAEAPLRDGIFAPTLTPSRAGAGRLLVRVDGDPAQEVDLGAVTVFADPAAAAAVAVAEPGGEVVSFLKESQWQLPFATALAQLEPLRDAVRASGELRVPPEAQARVDSPIAGRLVLATGVHIGAPVEAGAKLGGVVPLGGADGDEARAAAAAARGQESLALAAVQRAEALHPAMVSARELEAARAAAEAATAHRVAAEGRVVAWSGGESGAAVLRAPIRGVIAQLSSEPGAVVPPGAPIVTVVDPSTLWVQAHVFAQDFPRVRGVSGALVELPGRAEPLRIDPAAGGAVVAVGVAADPIRRTVPVVFSVPNPGDVVPGGLVQVRVYGPAGAPVVSIPVGAVVDDRGMDVVFVQLGGETFARRRVQLGVRDGDKVEVRAGVAAGERVVSRGAFELLLASSSGGIPEHGHGH